MSREQPLIAILTNNDDDVYCFRKELIEAIIYSGYRVLISCPYGEKFELMKDIEFIYDNVEIDRRGTNVKNDYKLYKHYIQLFKEHRPLVVLTYTAKPNVYGAFAAKKSNIPYICNVTGLGSVLNKKGIIKRFILWLFKKSYRSAACVMFQNSSNMKMALDSKMIKGDYKLIPGSGVALDRFPIQPYPEGGNGINGAPIVFNYIGRILHDKGVDDYIEAAKIIKQKYPKTEFNMIGFIEPTENHYEKDLEVLGDKGIVFYRGSQKDIRPWILRSHAIIHPSTYGEGMSNVLLENASSGRPIITTDNPGCKETVENGKTGFIYRGGLVEELVTSIEHFLQLTNAEREEMGLSGRRHVEFNFSRTIVVNAYLDKISKLVKE